MCGLLDILDKKSAPTLGLVVGGWLVLALWWCGVKEFTEVPFGRARALSVFLHVSTLFLSVLHSFAVNYSYIRKAIMHTWCCEEERGWYGWILLFLIFFNVSREPVTHTQHCML